MLIVKSFKFAQTNSISFTIIYIIAYYFCQSTDFLPFFLKKQYFLSIFSLLGRIVDMIQTLYISKNNKEILS